MSKIIKNLQNRLLKLELNDKYRDIEHYKKVLHHITLTLYKTIPKNIITQFIYIQQ